jgi:sec-independent protein translocase protein TatC
MSPVPHELPSPQEDLPRMSLLEHLDELRKRILHSVVAVTVAFFICWPFSDNIYRFLERPIKQLLPEGKKLVYTGVTDAFILYIKVAALAAVFLAAPYLLYQLWKFVSPGLYRRERLYVMPFIFFGSVFFLGGGAFAYYIAFPFAADFLLNVGKDFEPMLTIERYFRFLLTIMLGLGLMFELPVLIFLLSQMGLVTPRFLLRHFRWAVLIIFTVAAVITPTPDVFNLCLFALPTIGLYLLGIGASALVGWLQRREIPLPEGEA